ncbi:uncharacterized protein LOC128015461 isoform X6 [Carassius gibelio]|uniref:uncharacterized protein LOC128015461 isoform X6 n=1 Tax=Carassius gibelio TaxID=101364 RepID=UPI002278031F|nr:uncharacterized protein LOC128015461 isoform X6 [Carassius gibelio]
MSSYWAKRRRILKGVERDKQEIAAANDALLAVIPDFDQVNPPVNEHSTWEKHHFKFMKGAECWQEAMRYLVRFQTGSSVETTDDDKKRKRKRISNSKYRPQASSDEEESSLPDAPAVLSFGQPLLSFENIVPGNKVSVLPDAPEVASIPENQENVVPSVDFRGEPGFSPEIQTPLHRAKSLSTRHLTGYSPQQFLDERCRARQVLSFTPPAANLPWQHMGENAGGESHRSVIGPWTPLASRVQHEVFSYEDFQRLQNEKQAVMEENQALREENQALREENQALREENQALRESTARAASDDSGSLQEQVKQVGTMLKTFARTGQSGADQTLMLRRLGEFGDVVRSMDNKMDTMLQHFSANVSVGELSLPGDLLLPLDTQEDLALLDNSLRQDKELQERFLRFLAIKCGRDLKTTVWRMLQSIFSNHLSINTTWTGVGDKACFRDMFLKNIVQRAIRKNPATQDATDEAIQVNVTRYLKGASDREGGKRRRTAERDPQPTP